jgi:hypothetical protein
MPAHEIIFGLTFSAPDAKTGNKISKMQIDVISFFISLE